MNYKVSWEKIRIRILNLGTLMGVLGLILGFILILRGATGKFEVLGKSKGISIFVTSVSPGIFLALIGGVVNIFAFYIQIKSLGMPKAEEIKKRGGVEYYKQEALQQKNNTEKK